jgi:hypothetical protein
MVMCQVRHGDWVPWGRSEDISWRCGGVGRGVAVLRATALKLESATELKYLYLL